MKSRATKSLICSTGLLLICFSSIEINAQTSGSNPIPQFLFPSFTTSTVLLKDGTIYKGNFNYNMVDEEMVFFEKGKYLVPEKPQDIDTIYIQDSPFIPVEKTFYEVVFSGKISFFIQHKSKYSSVGTATAYGLTSQTNSSVTVSTVKGGNQVRSLDMPDNVQVTEAKVYWVRIGGEMNKFTSERQFLKLFPGTEDELKEFIKKEKIDVKSPEGLVKLGKFTNEIIK